MDGILTAGGAWVGIDIMARLIVRELWGLETLDFKAKNFGMEGGIFIE
jgi:hypothetical protein